MGACNGKHSFMSILGKIFTWWNGATFTTMLDSARNGELVGHDAQGNKYYRAKKPYPKGHPFQGRERRWVIYNGSNDASRVPAEWHGWLHGSLAGVPESNLPPPRIWEVEYTPNATGTAKAHHPHHAHLAHSKGAGEYEAWSPEASPEA